MNQRHDDDTAIQSLFESFLDGWNQGNGAAFAAPFTEKVDFIAFDGTHITSRREIEEVHQELFDKWLRGTRLSGTAGIRYLADDAALVFARGDTTMRGKTSPAPERASIQTLTAVRTDDGWRFTSFQNTRVRLIGQDFKSSIVWLLTDKLWKWFGGRDHYLEAAQTSEMANA